MNLLNLIGATLLAVSPIHEPKNVQIPSDSILQKVEYLDNNIIATSYITTYSDDDSNEYTYFLWLSDSKDIDLMFYYTVDLTYSNLSNGTVSLTDNINGDEELLEFSVSTEFLHNNFDSYLLDDSYCEVSLTEDLDNELNLGVTFSVPCMSVGNDILSLSSLSLTLDINEDNLSYYNNIFNSSNESVLYLTEIALGYDNIFNYFCTKYLFTIESSPITNGIFDIVGNTVENYLITITNLFSRVIALFYVDSKLTILGVLMVFTFGIGIVKFGFNLIKDLLRL